MFHFRSSYQIYTILLFIVFFLSSCSSMMDTSGSTDSLNNKQEAKESVESDKTKGDKSAVGSQPIVDPMADIKINPEIKKAYKNVANFNQLKQYPSAIKLLDEVKEKYPQLSGPDYQKARIYFNQGKLEQAFNAVELSLKSNGRNYYSLNLKGVILREQGMFEQSKDTYLSAIEIYPSYPNSHLNLGVLADIYLRELSLALLQYREYMKLVDNQDKKVANWILEIERRIKAEQ